MPGLYKPHTKYQHKTQVGHHIYVQNHRYIFIPIQAAEVLTTLNWRHIQSGYIHRLALYQPPYRATILNLMSIPNIPKRAYHHQHEYVNTHAQTPTRMHRHQHARTDNNTHAQTPTRTHRHQQVHTDTNSHIHKHARADTNTRTPINFIIMCCLNILFSGAHTWECNLKRTSRLHCHHCHAIQLCTMTSTYGTRVAVHGTYSK